MPLQVATQPQGLPTTPLGVRNAPVGVPTSLGVTSAPQQQITPVQPVQQPQMTPIVQPVNPQPQISSVTGAEPTYDNPRQHLDAIVTNMYSQGAPKEAVQAVVDDFKSKYQLDQQQQPEQPKSVLGFAGNVLKSTGSLIGNTAKGLVNVLNPNLQNNTLANAAALLAGAAKSTFTLGHSSTATFDNFTRLMDERYGGLNKIGNTLYNDPAGVALDLSTVLDPAGRAIGMAGDASKISQVSRAGELTTKVADAINPLARTADVVKGVTKFGGNRLAQGLGVSTGTGDALKTTFLNPSTDQAKAMRGATTGEDILKEAKTDLGNLKTTRGTTYRSQLADIKEANVPQNIASIQSKANSLLDEFRVKQLPDETGKPILNFDASTIADPAEQARIQRIYNDVTNWKDQTAVGLDTLKRRVASEFSPNSDVRAFTQAIKSTISQQLKDTVPGYEKMTSTYEKASNLIEDITKTLSLGDKASVETGIKKLASALKENNEMRAELLQQLQSAGTKDLTGMVAGNQLNSWVGRGALSKVGEGGIFGLAALMHNPATLSGLLFTSPRLMGELARGLGLTREALQAAIDKVPQPIRTNFGRAAKGAAFVNRQSSDQRTPQ